MFAFAFVLGVLWFGIESSFVFVIQAFLSSIGLIELSKTMLPSWLPISSASTFCILVLFGIFRGFVWFLRYYFSNATGQAFIRHQRSVVMEIGLKHASKTTTSEIMMAFNDHTITASYALQQLSQLVNNFVSLGLFVLAGFYLAPKEFCISILLLALALIPTRFLDSRIRNVGVEINIEKEAANRTLVQGLRNNFFLQVYHMINREIQIGKKSLERFEVIYKKYFIIAALRSCIPQVAGATILAVVTWLSLTYFKTPGAKLLSFFYIFIRLAQGASDFFAVAGDIRVQMVGLTKLYNWTESISKFSKEENSVHTEPHCDLMKEQLILDVDNASFSYHNKEILDSVSIKINPGERLLIQGESGAGKSTLLSLILGLNVPSKGSVKVGGQNPSKVREALSNVTGYVGPDPYLIPGTLKENLLYGHPAPEKVSDDEIWGFLESAQVAELASALPLKLNEPIFERAQLSTGQKQRLAIARALIRRPKLLILDEATANLDLETENKIIELLPRITSNMTSVIVSHKDSFNSIATAHIILKAIK